MGAAGISTVVGGTMISEELRRQCLNLLDSVSGVLFIRNLDRDTLNTEIRTRLWELELKLRNAEVIDGGDDESG